VPRSIPFLFFDAVCFVIRGAYSLFLGWWLNPLLKRDGERTLRRQVMRDLPFLFKTFGAKFVSSGLKDRWGKIVTLEAGNLLLQIAWDRGEYFLAVAPFHAPTEWEPISVAHMAITATRPIYTADDLPRALSFISLSELAPLLESEFELLQNAYSKEKYAATKPVLQKIDNILGISEVRYLVRTHVPAKKNSGPIQTLGL